MLSETLARAPTCKIAVIYLRGSIPHCKILSQTVQLWTSTTCQSRTCSPLPSWILASYVHYSNSKHPGGGIQPCWDVAAQTFVQEGSFLCRYDVPRGLPFWGRGRGRGDTKSLGRGM
jgi:hypothetical protein